MWCTVVVDTFLYFYFVEGSDAAAGVRCYRGPDASSAILRCKPGPGARTEIMWPHLEAFVGRLLPSLGSQQRSAEARD